MKRPAIGLILVLIGCAFLLDNLGWMHGLTRYIFVWPSILILVGIAQLGSGKPKPAMILFLVGGFFWINEFFHYDMRTYWPVILIVIGVVFIIRQAMSSNSNSSDEV